MEEEQALLLMGDVVRSRRDPAGVGRWLTDLASELNEAYRDVRMADFAFGHGDEIAGLLRPEADLLAGVLRAALSGSARKVRWVCVMGPIDAGSGDTTQRTGRVFAVAREALGQERADHERLVFATGRPVDELLNGLAPALVEMLDRLTPTQREVARLALIEGLRQSEVAERLGKRRATVSVSFHRARVVALERMVETMRKIYAGGVANG